MDFINNPTRHTPIRAGLSIGATEVKVQYARVGSDKAVAKARGAQGTNTVKSLTIQASRIMWLDNAKVVDCA